MTDIWMTLNCHKCKKVVVGFWAGADMEDMRPTIRYHLKHEHGGKKK